VSIGIRLTPNLIAPMQSAAMCGGFFLLLCEIRFEHRAVILDDWRPWMPIIFCALMLVVIPVATILRGRGGKSVLVACYCLSVCLGCLGLVLHSGGHLLPRLLEVFSVWTSPMQTSATLKALHPPLLAPAAFIGLGFIGLLFSATEKADVRDNLTMVGT
jgi:hypothetical protein